MCKALRLTIVRVVVMAMAALTITFIPTSAQASAYGVQLFGGSTLPYLGFVPKGSLKHWIGGRGLHVDSEWAEFLAVGTICNWRVDFKYYDANGLYLTYTGSTHSNSCSLVGASETLSNFNVHNGKAVAVLMSGGHTVARQVHTTHA